MTPRRRCTPTGHPRPALRSEPSSYFVIYLLFQSISPLSRGSPFNPSISLYNFPKTPFQPLHLLYKHPQNAASERKHPAARHPPLTPPQRLLLRPPNRLQRRPRRRHPRRQHQPRHKRHPSLLPRLRRHPRPLHPTTRRPGQRRRRPGAPLRLQPLPKHPLPRPGKNPKVHPPLHPPRSCKSPRAPRRLQHYPAVWESPPRPHNHRHQPLRGRRAPPRRAARQRRRNGVQR